MTSPIVRRARPDEYDAAGALAVRAYFPDDPGHTDGYAPKLRDAADRAAKAELLVAELDGHLAGTATFALAGTDYAEVARAGEAEFRMLGVAPEYRRRGVAVALVHACVRRAREAGCGGIAISVVDDAYDAQRLYGRLGFTRDPDRDWRPVPGIFALCYRTDV